MSKINIFCFGFGQVAEGFINKLIQEKKDFEFVLVPNGGHGVGETDYLFRRRQDFFVRSLLGVNPRR
jgi:hypothetical protein